MATIHPRLRTRESPSRTPGAVVRVMAWIPEEHLAWIEGEVRRAGVTLQIGQTVEHVVAALIEDPPPRPQILIVDLDAIGPGELMHLHSIREQGWFGKIVALGTVPELLAKSLGVSHVIAPPFVDGALQTVIDDTEFVAATTRIPVLNG